MKKTILWGSVLLLVLAGVLLYPRQWYPESWQIKIYTWFGASAYQKLPPTKANEISALAEEPCPPDLQGWRPMQNVEGVEIRASKSCKPDNPYTIAAAIKGTNRVTHDTLMRSGLAPDTVVMGKDLDGDGDPDEVEIHLEVAELNGGTPDNYRPVVTYDIAPGVQPSLWVFAPKFVGMAVENFESLRATPLLRAPSPVIRVEQGDQVKIILENTHYFPHTIHFHGVDHPYSVEHAFPHDESMDHAAHGHAKKTVTIGNDGVPETSELPSMPGQSHIYAFKPRTAGTFFYHCHVQPDIHLAMGLQGIFVVEPNRRNNWVQTFNIGAGEVRYPSVATKESYDQEYDMHYQDLDKDLAELVRRYADPRLLFEAHRFYDITDRSPDYFLLNGKSFPYTFQESLVVVKPNQKIKWRVLNGGEKGISLHTHGFKFTLTDYDGVPAPPGGRIMRDTQWISTAQRVDLLLESIDDGLHNDGPGIFMFHDHDEKGFVTDGISPGGSISAIAFEEYLDERGFPKTQGDDWKKFFTPEYYAKKTPIWLDYDPSGILGDVEKPLGRVVRIASLGMVFGALLAVLGALWRTRERRV